MKNILPHANRDMKTKGFTLVELMVVIAIIGILASIVLASLDSARKKGRDARRISDVKQIQLALELFYDANAMFPSDIYSASCSGASCLVTPGYISVVPQDPVAGLYSYSPYATTGTTATCISYHLGTSLETAGHSSLSTDADTTATPSGYQVCTRSTEGAATADFSGTDAARCYSGNTAGVACYDVRP